jgi:RNA polymerase sigma-70 factor (ECF subfamily)
VGRAADGEGRTTDKELVDALMAGESGRFDELYDRYQGRVFGFALRRVGNRVDAEDITQEVFLQIHRSIGSYQGRASLSTWIFGIAHNVTCRHFRSRGGDTVSLECARGSEVVTQRPHAERRLDAARAVEKCTSTLARNRTSEHLEIFRQFYGQGRPLRAIAGATGRPTDSVKDSLRRSRNLLLRDVPDIRAALVATGACA